MRTKRSFTALFALLLFSIVLLTSAPAVAHDPLEESHAHSVHTERAQRSAAEAVDLIDVRKKIIAFRETGDDRHLDDAQFLLRPILLSPNPDSETLVVASFVAQSRHQFEAAITLIRRSLAINERNDEAWLLLASIQLVRGELDAATQACRQLRNTPTLVLLTCNARVALAMGDHDLAYDRMTRILQVTDIQGLPTTTLAWSYSVAGDLAVAANRAAEATLLYKRSLALAERTQVRAALVDVLLQAGDVDAAATTLDGGSGALPLLVRRLIVANRRGQLQAARETVLAVQQKFEHWIANEDWLHAREMARFFVDVVNDPERARALAQINIELQKEPEDRRLLERTRQTRS